MNVKPNTFLIGVQKSATTSVYDWISQHPDVCAPVSMKDTPFFIDDKLYGKGFHFIENIYSKAHNGEDVILNGSAHTIYFPKGVERIAKYNADSKIIVVLRNPVERAISAYNFAVKRNLDNEDLLTSLKNETHRLTNNINFQILAETTYVDHGFYFRQLTNLRTHFDNDSILVIFYEDVRNKPEDVVKDIYNFLEIDSNFKPDLKKLNTTGSVRFKLVKDMVYNNSRAKKFLVKHVLDRIVSHDLKYRLKINLLKLITTTSSNNAANLTKAKNIESKHYIYNLLKDDIHNLEKMLTRDLTHWKYIEND